MAAKRIGQCWRYDEVGNDEKAEDYANRYKAACKKAKDERNQVLSPKQRAKMSDAYYKSANKQVGLAESVNEVGDTAKGQEKLGRLSARRQNQAFAERRKADMSLDPDDEQKHLDKKHDYMKRSIAAFSKAKDERDKKSNSWELPWQHMNKAYASGERKEERNKKAGK